MYKLLYSFIFLAIILSCSKSDSSGDTSSEINDSDSRQVLTSWSPPFTDQTSNFTQSRTGSNGTLETREINIDSYEEVLKSKEGDTDVNQDGDFYDITTQTISTYTASEGLGSFSSSGSISILSDLDIEIKNEGLINIDISEIDSGRVNITATASTDHEFIGWDGPSISIPTSINPIIIDIDSDKQLKANFLNSINPDYRGIGFYADSIYSSIDPNNLLSYVDAFILDAQRYGVDLSYVRDNCYNIVIEDFGLMTADGKTTVHCVDSQVRVELNKKTWEQNIQPFLDHPSGFYKDPYIFGFHLIWHELGHDILNLDHTCNETPNFLNQYSECEEGSDISLQYTSNMLWFTDDNNPETTQENKGFHRAVSNYYKLINQNPFSISFPSTTHEDIPCPVPYSATWIREIGDWRHIGEVGEDSYASDWCYSEERIGDGYSEYIGSSKREKILNQTISNHFNECTAEEW